MPFKEQPVFRYETLNQSHDCFRLCKLLSGSGDAVVRCELIHETISAQSGRYSALSYTWGSATEQRWIRLNQNAYHIQPSRLQALKAIRKDDADILIWVDAICINQAEVSERNHQVSIMGDIYRNAERVLAWLGPAADNSDAYFDCLGKVGAAGDESKKEMEESARDAVFSLNKRPFWRRAWIKQELILAKEITFYCGSRYSHDCERFFWVATLFTIDMVKGFDDYISKLYMHRISTSGGKSETLEQLLQRYDNTESEDPRDRVFALLHMASDCRGLESKLVEYNISVPALFFSLIAHFEPLNLLGFATMLQDVLAVRRAELLKYWRAVSANANIKSSSHMEQLAIDYIRKVDKCGKLQSSGESNSQMQDFITRSYLATCTPELLAQKDKLFQVEATEFCLRFTPTLFGFHLRGVYKSKAEVKRDEANEWEPFHSPYTVEQVWKYMILPAIMLDRDDAHIWDPATITEVKDAVVGNHGADAVKPDIGIICYTLGELARRDKFRDKCLCLVDCRYIVSALYGYSLLRPAEVDM